MSRNISLNIPEQQQHRHQHQHRHQLGRIPPETYRQHAMVGPVTEEQLLRMDVHQRHQSIAAAAAAMTTNRNLHVPTPNSMSTIVNLRHQLLVDQYSRMSQEERDCTSAALMAANDAAAARRAHPLPSLPHHRPQRPHHPSWTAPNSIAAHGNNALSVAALPEVTSSSETTSAPAAAAVGTLGDEFDDYAQCVLHDDCIHHTKRHLTRDIYSQQYQQTRVAANTAAAAGKILRPDINQAAMEMSLHKQEVRLQQDDVPRAAAAARRPITQGANAIAMKPHANSTAEYDTSSISRDTTRDDRPKNLVHAKLAKRKNAEVGGTKRKAASPSNIFVEELPFTRLTPTDLVDQGTMMEDRGIRTADSAAAAVPMSAIATPMAASKSKESDSDTAKVPPTSTQASWEEMFARLVDFKSIYGTSIVPLTYVKEDPKLVAWAQNQQQRRRTMLKSRKQRLEEIGFFDHPQDYDVDDDEEEVVEDTPRKQQHTVAPVATAPNTRAESLPQDNSSIKQKNPSYSDPLWDDMYKDLVAYKNAHGDCHVPSLYDKHPRLGCWVHALRQKSVPFDKTLRMSQEDQLNALGFVFLCDLEWNDMCEKLVLFQQQNGHCRIPFYYPPDKLLGFWVYYQRQRYHQRCSTTTMSSEERQQLADIGFEFKFKTALAGRDTSSILLSLSQTQEHARQNQRILAGSVDTNQSQEEVKDSVWMSMYEKLVDHKSRHEKNWVKNLYDGQLGKWAYQQWSNQDNLPPLYKESLMDIDFPFAASNWALLSATDRDSWDEMFQRLVEYKERYGDCDVPTRYKENPRLGRWIAKQRINRDSMPPSRKQRLEKIDFHWQGSREWRENWSLMFDRLVQYKNEHGDCLVPMRFKSDPKLGIWVRTQREKNDSMSPDRLRQLNEIGFVWRVKKKDHTWQQMYQRLVDYKEKNGDCMVPQRYKKDPKLGRWVNSQRLGRAMSDQRRELLDSIGFVWNLRRCVEQDAEIGKTTYTEAQWNDMYQRLLKYKKDNGDCHIPNTYKNDPELLHWVQNQRMNRDSLSDYCRKCLEEIGFAWSARKSTVIVAWDEMYIRLCKYKEENGHAIVPHTYKADPKLGVWVRTQRQFRESMSENRRQRLDDIGFVWKARRDYCDSWDTMFAKLAKYKEKHGNCMVPQRYTEDPKLGRWVNSQRLGRPMSEERKLRLKSIGFTWSPSWASWDDMYNRLLEYRDEHGDCLVPYRYQQDPKLGGWVQTQRTGRSSMSKDRRQMLDKVGFAWSVRKDYARDAWNEMFKRLVKYKVYHGDCLVPQQYKDDPKLGRWVHFQRQKRDTMVENRVQRLDAIGFTWGVGKKV